MPLPLEGIRILECSSWGVGPIATAALGDLGAEIIKVEEPGCGEPGRGLTEAIGGTDESGAGQNPMFEWTNRRKRDITVDIKKQEGREIIYRLIEKTDVFLQTYRPGVAIRLELDYEALSKYNPKLIYASGSGYGKKGEWADQPAFDMIGQARSGMMFQAGQEIDPPVSAGRGTADVLASIMLTCGILTALVYRNKTGVGQEIDASILGSAIYIQSVSMARAGGGRNAERHTRKENTNPLFNYYKCNDGNWFVSGLPQPQKYWPLFCQLLGIVHLTNDSRFDNWTGRVNNCKELIEILDKAFATKPRDEWVEIFRKNNLSCSPILNSNEVLDDKQALDNQYIVNYEHPILGSIKQPGNPVGFSKTPARAGGEAPALGQHTREVLVEAGYSPAEIEKLTMNQVI